MVAHEPTTVPQTDARGWVFYDGGCGFCNASLGRVERIIARRGFRPVPLQTPWVGERTGLSEAELMKEMRLLLPDGRILTGADAYLYVMRRIWWASPLALLLSIPGLRWLFARGYRWFANNRYPISRACGLRPPTEAEQRLRASVPPPPLPAAGARPSHSTS